MSDQNLLLFGCVVSFVAVAGIYVFMRERFTSLEREPEREHSRVEIAAEKAKRVA